MKTITRDDENYHPIEGHGFTLAPCPLCGSPAELWERTHAIGGALKAVMCTHGEEIAGLPNGCPMYLPTEDFYQSRKVDAVHVWNDFASTTRSLQDLRFAPLDPVAAAARKLQAECFGAANAAGWWHDVKTGASITDNPYCFSNKLMLTVSELSEAMEGDRKSLPDDKLPHRPMREVELADAVIRIFDLAGGFGLDLAGAISEKLAFNAQRPDHKIAHRQAAGGKQY